MTFEERLRKTLHETGSRITPISTKPSPSQRRRAEDRRGWMPLKAFAVSVGAVLLLGVVAWFVSGGYDPSAIDPAATHGVETVEIADLAVAVVDSEPVFTQPNVWVGLDGPAPEFDTSVFGPDLSFVEGEPTPDDLDDRVVEAVYLGDLDDQPFYIYSQDTSSIFDWFSEVIFGNPSGDILGTSLSCCSGSDMDIEGGLPGLLASQTSGEPTVIVAEWLGLSPDVSVVAYQFDGEFIGWQIPVGGAVSIQPETAPGEYMFIAYDSQGRELDRFGPHEMIPLGKTPEESSLLARGALEISADQIPTDDLREVISPTANVQLYALPAEDSQVIVVLSTEGQPHVYATSCEDLEQAEILHWPGTCLERTVNGKRESGIFQYP